MKTLIQKKNFIQREVKLTDTKIFCSVTKFGNTNEIDIPFENIDGEKVSYKTANLYFLLIAFGCCATAVLISISSFKANQIQNLAVGTGFTLALLFFILYWFSRADFWQIKLSDGNSILLHKKIPNEKTVSVFIDEIIIARNNYLRENYATIDENLDYESQLNNFKWLKSIKAISKEEYDKKYSELKKTINPSDMNIGFNKSWLFENGKRFFYGYLSFFFIFNSVKKYLWKSISTNCMSTPDSA